MTEGLGQIDAIHEVNNIDQHEEQNMRLIKAPYQSSPG